MSEPTVNGPVVLEEQSMGRIDVSESEDEGSVALDAYIKTRQISLREAMEKYDVLGANHDPVNGSFVVLAERNTLTANKGFSEMGSSHPSPFTAWTREEWNPKLRDKEGLREYYRMKRADGIVRGALRLLKTPIQAGRWFVEPASDSKQDKNIAKFVEENLFENLNVSWSNLLGDILLMCEYGYMTFEKVFEKNGKKQIVLRKLSPRHPLDIREWLYDANGGPSAVVMEDTEMDPSKRVVIPIEKLANFALEPEAGDMSGISVLRSAYKHYYYKDTLYKIDAIQKERHGIGVPVIKLPPGYTPGDLAAAEQLGRNLRTNERAYIVLPPMWEVMFAVLEGQPVDCMKSIEHHNMQIMANILAPFLDDSSVDPKSTDMFLKSTRYIGLTVCDIFNHHIIPQLVNFNFRLGPNRKYPKLRVRRIGEWEDIRTMSFALRNFVGAGAVIPDDILEDFLRRELDLPNRDEGSARGWVIGEPDPDAEEEEDSVDANQPKKPKPGRAGLPRQSGTPSVKQKKSKGRDVSGG